MAHQHVSELTKLPNLEFSRFLHKLMSANVKNDIFLTVDTTYYVINQLVKPVGRTILVNFRTSLNPLVYNMISFLIKKNKDFNISRRHHGNPVTSILSTLTSPPWP